MIRKDVDKTTAAMETSLNNAREASSILDAAMNRLESSEVDQRANRLIAGLAGVRDRLDRLTGNSE